MSKKPKRKKNIDVATYNSRIEYHNAYIFDVMSIEALFTTAQRYIGPSIETVSGIKDGKFYTREVKSEPNVTCSIDLTDDHNISSRDLSVLFTDPLVQSKFIQRMTISGSAYRTNPSRRISVTLRVADTPVEVSVDGDRESAQIVRNEIQQILEGKEQSYSFLVFRQFSGWSIFRAALSATVIFIVIVLIHVRLGVQKEQLGTFVVSWLGETAALVWFLGYLRRKLFPAVLFEIGRSAITVKRLGSIRYNLLWAVLVGLAVGVASIVFASKIFGTG